MVDMINLQMNQLQITFDFPVCFQEIEIAIEINLTYLLIDILLMGV